MNEVKLGEVTKLFKGLMASGIKNKEELLKFKNGAKTSALLQDKLEGILGEKITSNFMMLHGDKLSFALAIALEETVPMSIKRAFEKFADVREFEANENPIFYIRTTLASKRRLVEVVQKGAKAGVYQARRLDGESMRLVSQNMTFGIMLSFQDIITGQRTLAEYLELLEESISESINIEILRALRNLPVPKANKHTGMYSEFNASAQANLDALIRIVKNYGKPVLMGFPALLDKMNNGISNTFPETDMEEIKNTGRIGRYKGHTLVELPNVIVSADNTKWRFKENDLFIIPGNEKVIKIAIHKDGYMSENTGATATKTYNYYRRIGVGALANNSVAIFTDASIEVEGQY